MQKLSRETLDVAAGGRIESPVAHWNDSPYEDWLRWLKEQGIAPDISVGPELL